MTSEKENIYFKNLMIMANGCQESLIYKKNDFFLEGHIPS